MYYPISYIERALEQIIFFSFLVFFFYDFFPWMADILILHNTYNCFQADSNDVASVHWRASLNPPQTRLGACWIGGPDVSKAYHMIFERPTSTW